MMAANDHASETNTAPVTIKGVCLDESRSPAALLQPLIGMGTAGWTPAVRRIVLRRLDLTASADQAAGGAVVAQPWARHYRRVNAAQRYVGAARAHDLAAAVAEMAPEVVMRNPATDEPVIGRDAVFGALREVQQACDEFVHTQLLEPAADSADRIYGLIFRARIGDVKLQGVDLIELSDDDQIIAFTVIARPVASLMALGARIAANRSPTA